MTVGTMVTVRRSSRLLELERESPSTQGSRVTLLIQLLSPYSPLPIPWYSVPLEHQSYSFVSFDAFTCIENICTYYKPCSFAILSVSKSIYFGARGS